MAEIWERVANEIGDRLKRAEAEVDRLRAVIEDLREQRWRWDSHAQIYGREFFDALTEQLKKGT